MSASAVEVAWDPGLTQSFYGAVCALPNPRESNRKVRVELRNTQACNQSWGSAALSHSSQPTRKNFAKCVDAPGDAREIFRIRAARGRVLTCVRPLMRLTCRGPEWEFADQVQYRTTRSRRLSQSWFS